jgi:hypothetical protein
MSVYDKNKPQQSHIKCFNLAGRTTNIFEPDLLSTFNSIGVVILVSKEPREDFFWEEPPVILPWNS